MEIGFFNTKGKPVRTEELRTAKARDLALKLEAKKIDFAKLIECRKDDQIETVVFDVDVEVPQVRVHPILPSERIAATFFDPDNHIPIVHALRKNFPQVPHLNLHIQEFPRNLCLYDERYEDIKHQWTSSRFIQRIRAWLALTSRGELHQEDQPLEPILIDEVGHIVLPHTLTNGDDKAQPLFLVNICPVNNEKLFLVAKSQTPPNETSDIVASIHECHAQTHGIIHRRPTTLFDLAKLVETGELDIISELRQRLRKWLDNNKDVLNCRILLLIRFPKKRNDDGKVEDVDTWAFFLGVSTKAGELAGDLRIRDLGVQIGLWNIQDKEIGLLISPDISLRGENVCLDVLNVSFDLSRSKAARFNGNAKVEKVSIVAVGAGALGSQIMLNLARNGFGTWTIIDYDRLMPHNLARHILSGHFLGWYKAEAVAHMGNSIVRDSVLFSPLSVDVLSPGRQNEDVATAFRNAEVILDMSTSIAVVKKLVSDVESDARRMSLFMTPSGKDLVLLAEDKNRMMPLDALEMQYYRAVAHSSDLSEHFRSAEIRNRYGQSCRDITSALPQHLVALHAAIGAQAIRNVISNLDASVTIWRTDDYGNVKRVDVPLVGVIQNRTQSWAVITDEGLLKKLESLRENRLPNETGGVLLGSIDIERMIIYIVDALPSPPDSEEWPTLYIRGNKGLRHAVEELEEKTNGMLEYIGEWHSHPQGVLTAASCDDFTVFAWLTELMQGDGLPAVMMIVGDSGRTSCYAAEIIQEENLLTVASIS